ncbi:MAG: cell division protein FtsQ/DivIB [Ignavibacteriae bacterium]|nr:cell division protein FtsQ/DivIB [Ignavibacteriota bacterium]
MKTISNIKHSILLFAVISILVLLAFSLEKSEFNTINRIEIEGGKYLSVAQYLETANLLNIKNDPKISITVIQDRLEKHPFIKNIDISFVERGIVKATVYEKKMEAVLLVNNKQYMITDKAEIVPLLPSTQSIDLPVIVNLNPQDEIAVFNHAAKFKDLMKALNIITAAELYDKELCEQISEINLNKGQSITLTVSDLEMPIYCGNQNEIEKTVYLSKILKHLRGNNLSHYLDYLDLRFTDLVYLGFDNKLVATEGKI